MLQGYFNTHTMISEIEFQRKNKNLKEKILIVS